LGRAGDDPVVLSPYGAAVLLAGPSGSGKSSLARGILERLHEHGYQFSIVDPEGDYDNLEVAVTIGTPDRSPSISEVIGILKDPAESVVINLLALRVQERPAFFAELLPHVQQLRAQAGRPHWLVVDEAHHLLPATWGQADVSLPQALSSTLLITVHPQTLARDVLDQVDVALAVGAPDDVLQPFGTRGGVTLSSGEAMIWSRHDGPPRRFRILPGQLEQRRHQRPGAGGSGPPGRSPGRHAGGGEPAAHPGRHRAALHGARINKEAGRRPGLFSSRRLVTQRSDERAGRRPDAGDVVPAGSR